MTTATSVAGRPLSGWSRDTRWGTWYALGPGPSDASRPGSSAPDSAAPGSAAPGAPASGTPAPASPASGSARPEPAGALRIDHALLARQDARERLAATVVSVARLRLPGVLRTLDLVAEAGHVWLITVRPPAPTLADLLSADGPRPDAGSVASVLNETAQTLLALHAAGLAHGSLTADGVVVAPDGTALLAEAALRLALGEDRAPEPARRDDIAAWAGLARTLGQAWASTGTTAQLFARCADSAVPEGLAAARAVLVAGRGSLPVDFLRRTALRAAAAAASPNTAPTPTPQAPPPAAGRTAVDAPLPVTRPETGSETVTGTVTGSETVTGTATGSETVTGTRSGAAVGATEHSTAAPDDQLTAPARRTRAPRLTSADEQITVLGKRNRSPDTAHPASTTEDGGDGGDSGDSGDGEILLRFGPGVPLDEREALSALWRAAAADTPAPRRRPRAWIGLTVALTAVAVALWLMLLRPAVGPTVTAAEVTAPAQELHCGQTADVTGVLNTDGRGGPVTYRWLRSDGHDSGELIHTAARSERTVTVHLYWTVSGPGRFRGTARLQVIPHNGAEGTTAPIEAQDTFRYSCPST